MSRLRRLVLSDRYFFVTCNLLRGRRPLQDADFEVLARVLQVRRENQGFLLTAWAFLPDHWHAIFGVRYPKTISGVIESIKVSSTRQINARHGEPGRLWQGRFFDRALRTVKEYNETVEYIHWNPVRRELVKSPDEWTWSSYADYADGTSRRQHVLNIDRVRLPAEETTRV